VNIGCSAHASALKLVSQDTLGKFSVVEVTAQPGDARPAATCTKRWNEVFYVLEGTFRVRPERQNRNRPSRHVHPRPAGNDARLSATPAPPAPSWSTTTPPGGFERFFEECGVNCAEHATPPSDPRRFSHN